MRVLPLALWHTGNDAELIQLAARQSLPTHGHPGADHVLIGREAGLTRDFAVLKADLEKALAKAHLPPKDTEKPWQGSRR